MRSFRIGPFAPEQCQSFGVPCTAVERHRPDVLFEFDLQSIVEKILVAEECHPLTMEMKLVLVLDQSERGDGCRHLQEAVAQKLQSLVIISHAPLKVDLLGI